MAEWAEVLGGSLGKYTSADSRRPRPVLATDSVCWANLVRWPLGPEAVANDHEDSLHH